MAKRRNEWRARILRALHQAGDSGAAPFCLAAIVDLWAGAGTRSDFADPYDAYAFLCRAVSAVPAAQQLGSGATTRRADKLLDGARALRGDLRETVRWLRARPDWATILQRHSALLPPVSWWTPAVGDLLLLLREDPDSPDLDRQPPELRRAADLRQARVANWRTDLTRHVLGDMEPGPEHWMVAVVDLLWEDARVRDEFVHEAAAGERLLEMLAYSATAFVDYSSPDETEEPEGEGDEAEPGDLANVHPKALEALLSLNDDLIYLRLNQRWLDAMNRCAHLLPDGRWSSALACLVTAIDYLDETSPKPSPARGGTYFSDATAEAGEPDYNARPQRITIGDFADSTYMRKHWRREIARQEGVSAELADWIGAVAEDLAAGGEAEQGKIGGPHLVAWRLVEMVLAAVTPVGPGGTLDPIGRASLEQSAEFLTAHPAWRDLMARRVNELDDATARDAVLTLLSPTRMQERLREPIPIRPTQWREDLHRLLEGSRVTEEALLAFSSEVAADLWADPRVREEFGQEADVAAHLLRMVADSGMRYVVPGSLPATQPESMLTELLEQIARNTLETDTLEWLAQRPYWLAAMERHRKLLQEDAVLGTAVSELVHEARAHELNPVRGPAAKGDWRSRVLRHVGRLGTPGVGPFFVGLVERIWSSATARAGFADEFEVYEKSVEVVTSIATAVVIPGIATDYPELKVAMASARDPGPARERARTETIPWLRSHPEWTAAMRALLPTIPRENLFRLYVKATVQAGAQGAGGSQQKNRKKRR